jgi:hypothetical protein
MQADAEHQQDDSDLRQFVGKALVGDEAGREGTDDHAGQKIAHQRRRAQLVGNGTEGKSQNKSGDEHGDQGTGVHGSPAGNESGGMGFTP